MRRGNKNRKIKQRELATLAETKKRGEFFTRLLWTKMLVVGNAAT